MSEDVIRNILSTGTAPYSPDTQEALAELGIGFSRDSDVLKIDRPVELLDRQAILAHTGRDDIDLEVHWTIDSTNTRLMARSGDDFNGYLVCLAEQQVSGRGRRGRTWVSPFGANLYLSVARRYRQTGVQLGGLSLVLGVMAVSTLRELGMSEVGLKWPNDILHEGGKLAGILVEVGTPSLGRLHTVAGIGVNLYLDENAQATIDQPFSAVGQHISRNELAGRLLANIIKGMEQFAVSGLTGFRQLWHAYHLYQGQEVQLTLGNDLISGRAMGIDENGNLLLDGPDGLRAFNAGEVSLRPA